MPDADTVDLAYVGWSVKAERHSISAQESGDDEIGVQKGGAVQNSKIGPFCSCLRCGSGRIFTMDAGGNQSSIYLELLGP